MNQTFAIGIPVLVVVVVALLISADLIADRDVWKEKAETCREQQDCPDTHIRVTTESECWCMYLGEDYGRSGVNFRCGER